MLSVALLLVVGTALLLVFGGAFLLVGSVALLLISRGALLLRHGETLLVGHLLHHGNLDIHALLPGLVVTLAVVLHGAGLLRLQVHNRVVDNLAHLLRLVPTLLLVAGSGEGFLHGVAHLPGLVPALLLPHQGAWGGRVAATVSHAYQQ